MRRFYLVLTTCLVIALAGCGTDDVLLNQGDSENASQADTGTDDPDAQGDGDSDGDPDADEADAGGPGADAGDGDGDGDEFASPNLYQSTSAGGSVEGGGYRMVIGVGAPVPKGQAEGGGYRIQVGPVSP